MYVYVKQIGQIHRLVSAIQTYRYESANLFWQDHFKILKHLSTNVTTNV